MPLDALILGVSAVAVLLSLVALTRSTPATLRSECEEARARSISAVQAVNALTDAWEAKRVELGGMVEQLIEERERATKDRARARAERQRAESATNGPHQESRTEKLARLRRESGVLSGV